MTTTPDTASSFQSLKDTFLSKPDKSSAGRIDPRAVAVCSAINSRPEYYTTSSCAGRCFLYRGDGIKSHHHFAVAAAVAAAADGGGEEGGNNDSGTNNRADDERVGDDGEGGYDEVEGGEGEGGIGGRGPSGLGYFERYRISHGLIRDPVRYFDLTTLNPDDVDAFDATGGGDHLHNLEITKFREAQRAEEEAEEENGAEAGGGGEDPSGTLPPARGGAVWLRFEPFILHVACRSLESARALLAAARPAFKSAGLTSWRKERRRTQSPKQKNQKQQYIVAIWGDEGLEMPLCLPEGGVGLFWGREGWLAELVNERHRRNWAKVDRFAEGVRAMPMEPVDADDDDRMCIGTDGGDDGGDKEKSEAAAAPKRFDVVGDVALLHIMPEGTPKEREAAGRAVMRKNNAIKICAARVSSLSGPDRSPGEGGIVVLAGPNRDPLVTSHSEHGIKCVVDLRQTFFSPRMGPERLRVCSQVARDEVVLVAFCGVGMDALQIAGRTECRSVVAVEKNAAAVECARRGRRMLMRNRSVLGGNPEAAAGKLTIIEGDIMEVAPTLEGPFDRIVAPRPKEGDMDGDLGNGDGGVAFLEALLPLLRSEGSECHWYDFCADHELPACERTRRTISGACDRLGVNVEFVHMAQVGSVAKRQFRVCAHFRLIGRKVLT